jgi:hypothetical protein
MDSMRLAASTKLPDSAHISRSWRIHELLTDFRLEDVWALPTPGGPDDFPALVQGTTEMDPARGSSPAARALFAVRWKLGELFNLDGEGDRDSEAPTIRDRLPADLRDGPRGPAFETLPFEPLYLCEDEFAAEVANRTVHGVLHLGWVEEEPDLFHGQMAVYVKPNGLLGEGYMTAIRPFRHLVVYPPMMRDIGRQWRHRVLEADHDELEARKREWRRRFFEPSPGV